MALLASTIINRAAKLLSDREFTHWTKADLLDWINEGVGQIVQLRPDANEVAVQVSLAAGARQQIPTDSVQLVRVDRNVGGRAILQVRREDMDAFNPGWVAEAQTAIVSEYMADKQAPKFFWVYPPNNGAGSVELVVSKLPSAVVNEGSDVGLGAEFASPLLHFVMYRAMDHSTESSDKRLARDYWDKFLRSIALDAQVDEAFSPEEEVTDG